MLDPPALSAAPEPQPASRTTASTSAATRSAIAPMLRRRSRRVIRGGHSSRRGVAGGTIERWQRPSSHRGRDARVRWRRCCPWRTRPPRVLVVAAARGVAGLGADHLRGAVDDGVRVRPGCRPRAARRGVRRASATPTTATAGWLVARRRDRLVRPGLGGLERRPGGRSGASVPPLCRSSSSPPALLVASAIRSSRSAARPSAPVAVVVLAAAVVRALVRDPLLDPYCWRDCVSRSLVVHAEPSLARDARPRLARDDGGARRRRAGRRAVARRRQPRRRAGGCSRRSSFLRRSPCAADRPRTRPRSSAGRSSSPRMRGVLGALLRACGRVLRRSAPGSSLVVALRLRQRAAVSRLADRARGGAGAPLARAFGDPTAGGRLLASGSRALRRQRGPRPSIAPTPTADRAVTPIVRGGSPVAVVMHDAALTALARARARLGGPARDRERTAPGRGARPARGAAAFPHAHHRRGDAERRRLERDLHDGAQQRLLALVVRPEARACGRGRPTATSRVATTLATAIDEAQTALEELRELAHGIYPAVLAEAGLAVALATLADEAPLPVDARRDERAVRRAGRGRAVRGGARGDRRRSRRERATWARVSVAGRVTADASRTTAPRAPRRSSTSPTGSARSAARRRSARDSLRAEVPCA